MQAERQESLEALMRSASGMPPRSIVNSRPCSGGCIHQAELLMLDDGSSLFVKSGPHAGDMFAQEALGLTALAKTGTLRVPQVVAAGMLSDSEACLILEAILPGPPQTDFWERLGQGLAALHRQATAGNFGWSSDNYIGSNRQPNSAHASWVEFFAVQRLGFQLQLARTHARGSRELFKLGEQLIAKLDKRLGPCDERPSLLHGDLWSGNYLVASDGAPVLIDPACYFGLREADLAMPLLFGGFPQRFFDAYDASWPLAAGWRERVEIYKLYHLLNHLNLFGSGYLDSCLEILRRFC